MISADNGGMSASNQYLESDKPRYVLTVVVRRVFNAHGRATSTAYAAIDGLSGGPKTRATQLDVEQDRAVKPS